MKYIVTINDKNYEVLVEKSEATLLNVTDVAAVPVPVSVSETVASEATSKSAQAPVAGEGSVNSPMPGTILEIKKAPGSSVKMGEVILILEAMKMENEIPAPNDGVIGQIFVTKNSSVSTGDPLFSLN